jgi:uncharacterized RDD family membrane protein YckC
MSAAPGDGLGQFQGALDVTLDLPLAGIGTRIAAHLIDLAVVTALLLLNLAVTSILSREELLPGDWLWAGYVVLNFLIFWGYFVASELLMAGQSPGKRALGLRVVGRDGAAVDLVSSLVRNLIRYIDFLPGGYGLGALVMIATERSQRLGDLAAGTVVVREARGAARRRWPEALSAADVALLESWLSREAHLRPERRLALAEELLRWLRRDHPALAAGAPAGAPADEALSARFAGWS